MISALVDAGCGIVALAVVFGIIVGWDALAELERVDAARIRPGDQLVALNDGLVDILKVTARGGRVEITTPSRVFELPAVTKVLRRKLSRRIVMRPDLESGDSGGAS